MAPIRDDAAFSPIVSSYVYIAVLIILSAAVTFVFHCVCCRKKKNSPNNNNDGGVSMPGEKSNSSSSQRRKLSIIVDDVRDISSSTTDTTGSPQDKYAKRKSKTNVSESKKAIGVRDSKATTTGVSGGKKSNVGKKMMTTTAVVGGLKTKAKTELKVKKTMVVNKGELKKSVARSDVKPQKFGIIHVMSERAVKANDLSLMSQKKEINGRGADTGQPITSETFYLKTAMVAPDMEDTDFILRASYMDPSIGQGEQGDNVIIPSILRRRSDINGENGTNAAAAPSGPKDSGSYMEIHSASDDSISPNLALATTAITATSTRLGKANGGGTTATVTATSKTGSSNSTGTTGSTTGSSGTESAPISYMVGESPQQNGGKASAVVKTKKKKRKRKKSKPKK